MKSSTGLSSKATSLMYKFGTFRPSERAILYKALHDQECSRDFTSALNHFLKKWDQADWLEEYNVERVAIWTAINAPDALIKDIRLICRAGIKTFSSDIRKASAYKVFLKTLNAEMNGETGAPTVQPFNDLNPT